MSKRADAAYLQDIVDQRRLVQDGVTFRLEIIGEACRGLSAAFRQNHPESPWEDMIGMRNRLIHGYFDLNSHVVFDTATVDVPQLLGLVRGWLDEIRGDG